jgi:hypothetical protein
VAEAEGMDACWKILMIVHIGVLSFCLLESLTWNLFALLIWLIIYYSSIEPYNDIHICYLKD